MGFEILIDYPSPYPSALIVRKVLGFNELQSRHREEEEAKMGGKGKKRREKNYRAAHGGTTRLPPPLNTSSIDAIPSKLRQIMAFSGEGKGSSDNADRKKGDSGGNANGKKIHSEDQVQAKNAGNKRKDDKSSLSGVGAEESNSHQKRNKKRKRKEVKDLWFDTAELGITSSKRKEQNKQRLVEMKKKHKRPILMNTWIFLAMKK